MKVLTLPPTRPQWWDAKAVEVHGAAGWWVLIWTAPTGRRGGRPYLVRKRLALRGITAEARSTKVEGKDLWQVWAREVTQ
jgi:hypothetical protein